MPVARTFTVALQGLTAHVVEVEADIAQGLPGFVITGGGDPTLREARERVRAAAVNSGAGWPARRITVGLSPAAVPKTGSALDVAIAVAVLAAAGAIRSDRLAGTLLLGELGLDGALRPVSGVLPAVLGAIHAGLAQVVVPLPNAAEARLVAPDVIAARSLGDVLHWLDTGEPPILDADDVARRASAPHSRRPVTAPDLDLADVVGQDTVVRALEVAAAGGHHVLLSGPPGVGKTMLAERLPGLLPDLSADESLEVSAIHSVAGTLPPGGRLLRRPPFCAPHHTSSTAALIGGGSRLAMPGAASLAHLGVLFLDEAPEFGPRSLDALRQPLESGEVIVGRAGGVTAYPARFLLVLAANPCGCALTADPSPGSLAPGCTCSPSQRMRYQARMSGPLMDRIDIRLYVGQPDRGAGEQARGTPSAVVRDRVAAARERAGRRLGDTGWRLTGDVPGPVLRRRWPAPADGTRLLDAELRAGRISPRGVDRILRLAWTLSDLDERDRPSIDHVAAALSLRQPAGQAPLAPLASLTGALRRPA